MNIYEELKQELAELKKEVNKKDIEERKVR